MWTGSTAANVAATVGQLNQATAYLSNYNGNASTLPIVEGLRLDAYFPNADSVQPRFVNTSTGNVKAHYSSEAPNQGVGAANVVLGASNYMVVGSSSGISATRGANQVSTGTGADYSGAGSSIESMKIN